MVCVSRGPEIWARCKSGALTTAGKSLSDDLNTLHRTGRSAADLFIVPFISLYSEPSNRG